MSSYEAFRYIYLGDERFCYVSQELWDEVQTHGRKNWGYVRVAEPLDLDRAVTRPGKKLEKVSFEVLTLDVVVWKQRGHPDYYVAQLKSREDGEKFLKWHPQLAIQPIRRRF